MLQVQNQNSHAVYRVAMGFTIVYSTLLAAGFWFGGLRGESVNQFITQCMAASLVVNVGLPALAGLAKNVMARRLIFHRAVGLVVTLGIINWAGLYYGVEYLYQGGLPGWLAWIGAIAISGMVTLLATFFTLGGTPSENKRIDLPAHIGALRENETWIRGAKVLPPDPSEVPVPGQLSIGGIPIDWRSEVYSIMMCGAVGSGKSQIIQGFLREIRKRSNARVIVLDHNGGYYSRFCQPGDTLLNPLDVTRTVNWSMFAEMKSDADYKRIAAGFVPLAEGTGAQWSEFGRDLLADTMRAMNESGERNPQKLYRLLTGPQDKLTNYLADAGLLGWTSPHGQEMMAGCKGTIKPYIGIFEKLKEDGDFSVRDWVKNGDGREGWLFVTYREADKEFLRQFVAAVADCAVVEGLNLSTCEGLPEAEHRRLFYIFDELDSIGNISKLVDGFSRGRKLGCSFIVGIQLAAQLRLVYGKEIAKIIQGNVATRAVLRQEDGETALEMQQMLGEQDIERQIISHSQTAGNSRPGLFSAGHGHNSTGMTASEQIQPVTRPCILASELQAMERLHGVLMRGDKPHNPFKLKVVPMPIITPPFVEAAP
jgi:hypothetical protein